MKQRMYSEDEKCKYAARFSALLIDLEDVGKLPEREVYLYPFMDRVIFKDFETAVDGVIIDFETPPEKKT